MKLRPFELALVIIFGFLFLAAIFLLSSSKGGSSDNDPAAVVGSVSVWGTVSDESVNSFLTELKKADPAYNGVSYKYYPAEEFDGQLLTALADGEGPDLVLISHEKLIEMRKRIQPISYESFPKRDIIDFYVEGAQIFALSDGLYAYPIMMDPLMMFWNSDIITNEGFFGAPKTWEEFVNQMFPRLIKRDFNRTIERGVVAMGEYGNVRNAFGILSALLIQGGSELVSESSNDRYSVRLHSSASGGNPLSSAADFYTRFSKPSNNLYSWNRSFTEDRSEFSSGNLIFYFGYGSEAPVLEKINPNLNFDIAEFPQGESATVRRTYGKFYGLSVLNSAKNKTGASAVMLKFGGGEASALLAKSAGMVPVRKTTLMAGSNDKYGRITYQSAAIARGWLNPDIEQADEAFAKMTADINENRRSVSDAALDTVNRLGNIY